MSKSTQRWIFRLLPLVILFSLWEWYGRVNSGLLFPTFGETLVALQSLLTKAALWEALWLSHQALLLGYGAALLVGIPLGIMAGYSPHADAIIDPYVRLLLVVPKSALVPIFILALGIDLVSRAWVIFLYVIVYIIVNMRAGVRQVDSTWVTMARSFGAAYMTIWLKILLPGALPALMAALRIGLGRAMAGMITVELLLAAVGVGRLIIEFRSAFDAGSTYAVVIVVLVEALLLNIVLRWFERRWLHWAT